MDRSMTDTALRRALDYARLGWSVVPLRHASKIPLVRWEAYQQRRASDDEIRSWWSAWPDANVAVVTGRVSGFAVLDVDPRHGGDASLASLEESHGPLPPTVEARTGGGGRHLYFALPGEDVRSRIAFAPGLDLRAEGGLVVAPPSIHPSGGAYAWRPGCAPEAWPLAPLPLWLREPGSATRHRGHPVSHWRDLVTAGVGEGARNTSIASLAGHLLWHGVDPEVVLELLLCWNRVRCQPPLPGEEVARTVASIVRTHERGSGVTGD